MRLPSLRRTTTITFASIALTGLVCGCSSSTALLDDYQGPAKGTPTTVASSDAAGPDTAPVNSPELPEISAPGSTITPGEWGVVPLGAQADSENDGQAEETQPEEDPNSGARAGARLDSYECGVSDFAERDEYGFRDESRPLYADTAALPGMEFCLFRVSLAHSEAHPTAIPQPGAAVLGTDVVNPLASDAELSTSLTVAQNGRSFEEIPSGNVTQVVHAVSVPEGSVVTGLLYPAGDGQALTLTVP